jgi:recombinational DNA repair ATPase RecF
VSQEPLSDADATGELVDMVMQRAEESGKLDDEQLMLLLDALQGDDTGRTETARATSDPASPADPAGPAAGIFVSSVTVAGFRGIGPEARLDLRPGPGLTIVAGRNGSGKSTFSEAIETALTGDSYRWRKRKTQVWQADWRNLRESDPCRVRLTLTEEGIGTTVVEVDWAPGAKLDGSTTWVQRGNGPRQTIDALGWGPPMELYRPVLSYEELSGLLDGGQSQVYDALSKTLGLSAIADAQQRVDDVRARAREPRLAVDKRIDHLRPQLEQSPDDRAHDALRMLSAGDPDIDELQRLAAGVRDAAADPLATLRAVAALRLAPAEAVAAAESACVNAVERLAAHADTNAEAAERRIALFTHVVTHLDAQPDALPVTCPLCRVGTLDRAWLDAAHADLAGLRRQTDDVRAARATHATALAELRELLPGAPRWLLGDGEVELAGRHDVVDAWIRLTESPLDTIDDVRRFAGAHADLATRLAKLHDEAAAELSRREDAWAPLAAQVAQVATELQRVREADAEFARAKAVGTWLKDQANDLRNERLRPIAEHSRRIWAELRQESNVDLGEITLTGTKSARKAVLAARVDGAAAGALGVMSQGELHALSLALFLPRAIMPASPFRFVIIDDPVQAMDPAKVDGLARVLADIATTRQVVVFSHDDRLPEAVRRLTPDARIVRVHRSEGSRVAVVPETDPAQRHLDDARAVVKDPGADRAVRRRVVPILCRLAVESACRDIVFARRLGRGDARSDVEQAWDDAKTARRHLALALRDDARADLTTWTNPGRRGNAMRVIGRANHDGLDGDALGAVDDVAALIRDLRAATR